MSAARLFCLFLERPAVVNCSFKTRSIFQSCQKEEQKPPICKKAESIKTEGEELGTELIAEPTKLDPQRPQPRVVIVGAGMAGLSAAQRLVQCGLTNVVVVEALERPGGRIHTCYMSGAPAELGALWIDGCCVGNPLWNLARREGILKPPIERIDPKRGIYLTSGGGILPRSVVDKAFDLYEKTKRRAEANFYLRRKSGGSLKSFMKKGIERAVVECFPDHERSDASSVLHSLTNEIVERWGESLARISAEESGTLARIPGGVSFFPEGYREILRPMIEEVKEERIMYKRPVEMIEWGPVGTRCPRAVVKCRGKEEIPADYVLVTISLGVLKEKGDSLFDPKLPPGKLEAVDKLGYGLVNRVHFRYDKPFWLRREGFFRPVWSEEELEDRSEWLKSVALIEENPTSRDTLMFSVGGCEAFCVERLSEAEIVEQGTRLLRRLTRSPGIPFPKAMLRSTWFSDPYFKGSNSYPNVGSKTAHRVALSEPLPENRVPVAPVLFFAGEATVPGSFGTVRGARVSGIREADRILQLTKSLGGPPKCEPVLCRVP